MRIGIFLPEISPERGGAFTFVETAVAGLLDGESRDSLAVFHYGDSGDVAKYFAGKPIEFHSLAKTRLGWFAKKVFYGQVAARLQAPLNLAGRALARHVPYPAGSPLDRAARARGVDLMLFPTPMFERVDIPYGVTVWDLEHRAHPYFPELAAQGEWNAREHDYTRGLQRATYIITGTTVGRDEIVHYYGVDASRVRILPHPTPAFALAGAAGARPALELSVPGPYVLYPAQFWSHKNHIGLVNAIAALERRGTTVHAALVGSDKGNRDYVKARAEELGVGAQIHFLGFVERKDLVALYRNAAALVYTSLCGPENLPPLEAMALGCPVINSDIAGAREQLGDAALLVDTLDPEALADAIQRVLSSDETRATLADRGKVRAAKYTQAEFGRDLRVLIEDFRRRRELWG